MDPRQPILEIAVSILIIDVSLGICISVSHGMSGSRIALIVVSFANYLQFYPFSKSSKGG